MTMVVIMRKYCMAAVLMFSILFTIYSKGLAIAANAQEAVLTLEPANTHIDYTVQGWPPLLMEHSTSYGASSGSIPRAARLKEALLSLPLAATAAAVCAMMK
jgi:hypothetical protein